MPEIDGKLLREWRRARGWDVPQLARQLRRASREPIAAHDGLVRMIRSWERGAHTLSERYELLYQSLGFGDTPGAGDTGAEHGDGTRPPGRGRPGRKPEIPAHSNTSASYATLGTADSSDPDTDTVEVCCRTQDGRIVFVAVPLSQLTGEPAPAVPPAGAAMPRVAAREAPDGRPAERFLIARRALRDNDNLFGPRDVIPLAMRQLAQMRDLSKSLRGDDRRELLLPQIQFADLLGWLYQDSCEYDAARRWLDRALRWAHALGDDNCVAFVLARRSQLACDTRDVVTAIAAAGAAMRLAGRYSLTSAAAATYGAHGHALARDAVASGRLYERARETLRRAGTDAPAGRPARWATFLDTAYIDVYHAHSLAVLGQHPAAAARFEAAIGALRPGYHRDRGVYLAREARARANAGEYDRAAQLAVRALTIGAETGSARIFAELTAVRDGAMASCDSPDAAWFRDRLAAAGR